jgi:hypothetical protein
VAATRVASGKPSKVRTSSPLETTVGAQEDGLATDRLFGHEQARAMTPMSRTTPIELKAPLRPQDIPARSPGTDTASMSDVSFESESSDPEGEPIILPRYLRYARALALLSGAAVGIAAGMAAVSTTGCSSCSGTPCGGPVYQPPPAQDAAANVGGHSGSDAAVHGANDSGGGGPRPAPRLPRGWIA